MTSLELIAAGYRMGRQFVAGMCADLTSAEFHHQPIPGTNSAAWIVGHLTLTARRTAERLGATGLPEVSEDMMARYKVTRQVAGDQHDLGEKAELLALFEAMVEKLMQALLRMSPEALDGPPPNTALPFVTSAGDMLVFGAMHFTLHAGQLSTIRRSLGKPPMA